MYNENLIPNLLHRKATRVGLALSGGSVRGLAHIGVLKALAEAGVQPEFVAGTSAGSVIGAAIAAGMEWRDIIQLAREVFWPKLLYGPALERFCERHLPRRFSDLRVPFAAVATRLPSKLAIALTSGYLASAISASCAMRVIRRPVLRDGQAFKDGGIACVLPSEFCRKMGADFVIGSDVWEISSLLRGAGLNPAHPVGRRAYPLYYRASLRQTDLLVHPRVPLAGYWPGEAGIEQMVAAGETAARYALSRADARWPESLSGMAPALPHPAPLLRSAARPHC
jgi:NTE family protein